MKTPSRATWKTLHAERSKRIRVRPKKRKMTRRRSEGATRSVSDTVNCTGKKKMYARSEYRSSVVFHTLWWARVERTRPRLRGPAASVFVALMHTYPAADSVFHFQLRESTVIQWLGTVWHFGRYARLWRALRRCPTPKPWPMQTTRR